VEIARSEAEGATVVVAHDGGYVVGAQGLLRMAHARGTVVVSGERQRPGAEHPVVVGEELRRGFSGTERIQTIVHRTVDAQVAPSGGAHELPQSRRPD